MPSTAHQRSIQSLTDEFTGGGSSLPGIWGRRAFWQVRLRWGVPPIIAAAIVVGRWLGFEFPALPILLVAVGILLYNIVFALTFTRREADFEQDPQLERLFTILQVCIDYTAMFVLIYATGGAASPLIFFFLFHVIIAAIQFRPSTAFLFAGLATGGLWLLTLLQLTRVLPYECIGFKGVEFSFLDWPAQMLVVLSFFTATVIIAAMIATRVMSRLRERVVNLAETTAEVATLNERLNSLYAMLRAVGSEVRLKPVLKIVTAELAMTLEIGVVSVKLLSEDGKTLRFVAAHGLPDEFLENNVVQLAKSPLNRSVIEGETLMHGGVVEDDEFQIHADLVAMGIESVVFAPLTLEDRIIGILGAYSDIPDRFDDGDTSFLRLAAELVAVAIENARSYEAIEDLMNEHTKFMMQVAHNMRAPIGASVSMLQLVADSYLGAVTEQQQEYLTRVDQRLSSLNQTIGELLNLGRTRDRTRDIVDVRVDVNQLVEQIERTFRDEAESKGLSFRVITPGDLPLVDSGANLLDQILENLVSNAIKYTPPDGEVELSFSHHTDGYVRFQVRDTGIGIPADEQQQLGKEFFRASNAKKMKEVGTGLGLAFVKQAVERHNGHLRVASEEGHGTTVTVDLPIRQAGRSISSAERA